MTVNEEMTAKEVDSHVCSRTSNNDRILIILVDAQHEILAVTVKYIVVRVISSQLYYIHHCILLCIFCNVLVFTIALHTYSPVCFV